MSDVMIMLKPRGPTDPAADLQNDEVLPERRKTQRRKLVIEISPDLHRRIITICTTRRVPVNKAVRDVLEHAFPSK